MRLLLAIRHLKWDRECPVPTCNPRRRCASRYKRLQKSRKSYLRLAVWGEPGCPWWLINLVTSVGGVQSAHRPPCCGHCVPAHPVPSDAPTDLSPGTFSHLGRTQHTSCPVGLQHAPIAIPLLGDATRMAGLSRAVLLGRQAKPAGDIPRILEMADSPGSEKQN